MKKVKAKTEERRLRDKTRRHRAMSPGFVYLSACAPLKGATFLNEGIMKIFICPIPALLAETGASVGISGSKKLQ